jgi:hypothetical protein
MPTAVARRRFPPAPSAALLPILIPTVYRAQRRRLDAGVAVRAGLTFSTLNHLPKFSAMILAEADAVCAK